MSIKNCDVQSWGSSLNDTWWLSARSYLTERYFAKLRSHCSLRQLSDRELRILYSVARVVRILRDDNILDQIFDKQKYSKKNMVMNFIFQSEIRKKHIYNCVNQFTTNDVLFQRGDWSSLVEQGQHFVRNILAASWVGPWIMAHIQLLSHLGLEYWLPENHTSIF